MPGLISRIETFFDRLKLGYKWKFDRWESLRIVAYPGFGTREKVFLRVRVLDDQPPPRGETRSLLQSIRANIQRIETDEVPGARVSVRVFGREEERLTDSDGFAEFEIDVESVPDTDETPHEATYTLLAPVKRGQHPVQVTGPVSLPSVDAEFMIVSDVDDTIIRTGATDRLKMFRTVLFNSADSRTPFSGVSAFYRALALGPDGHGRNPIFYISSSPWNLFDVFQEFMEIHEIPAGTIFLKDLGFAGNSIFGGGHEDHKLVQLRRLRDTYPDLPLVLIGDSGQKDPEIYRDFALECPERVRAIYIRDVTSPRRDEEVRTIARDLEGHGVAMILAEDTEVAARHAVEAGLIGRQALEEVRTSIAREEKQRKTTLTE